MLEPVQARERSPELKLWQQCLALMVCDAACFHQGLKKWGADKHLERAYIDVTNKTDRLKWVCALAGSDADYVCERFKRWTARHPQGVRFRYKNHADLA